MNASSAGRRSFGKWAVAFGVGAMSAAMAGQAVAGCSVFGPVGALPAGWNMAAANSAPSASSLADDPLDRGTGEGRVAGIVGMWKFTLISDGTAYPAPIPYGAVVDFGTQQWHSDGNEFMISGARPPSSGDVCMGVWRQSANATYKLKHIALAWVSSDTAPPLGPVIPAAFVGPAIIHQTVTLRHGRNAFEGTFTLDQYAKDEITLLQHIGGRVLATRVVAD